MAEPKIAGSETPDEVVWPESAAKQAPVPPPVADPWIHRSAGMRCRTCVSFVLKVSEVPRETDLRGSLGRCRKHAPTMSGFPVVFETDWCGDHKIDEDKI